jgi:dTDP-4-dehydrorhamnose reductase
MKNVEREAGDTDPHSTFHVLPYGVYHLSGTGACSWYDFAAEIFKQSNVKIDVMPITTKEYPQKAERPKYSYMSKDKIEKALGIKVRSWQEMLLEYLDRRGK